MTLRLAFGSKLTSSRNVLRRPAMPQDTSSFRGLQRAPRAARQFLLIFICLFVFAVVVVSAIVVAFVVLLR